MIYLGATIGIVILEIIYNDMNKMREREEKRFKENVWTCNQKSIWYETNFQYMWKTIIQCERN